jgi:hypothetical protein
MWVVFLRHRFKEGREEGNKEALSTCMVADKRFMNEDKEEQRRRRKLNYLVPAQGSDARVEEFGFHVGAVVRVAFHVVDTLGMPHLHHVMMMMYIHTYKINTRR